MSEPTLHLASPLLSSGDPAREGPDVALVAILPLSQVEQLLAARERRFAHDEQAARARGERASIRRSRRIDALTWFLASADHGTPFATDELVEAAEAELALLTYPTLED